MHLIFRGLAIWATVFMVAETGLGVFSRRLGLTIVFPWHFYLGIFTGLFVTLLHCLVMFHFIGSGKELKEAAETLGGDRDVVRRVRSFKVQTSGVAFLSMCLIMAVAIVGGGSHVDAMTQGPGAEGAWTWAHRILAVLAVLLNLYAFPIEYRALKANLDLIEEVDRRLKQAAAPRFMERES